MAIMFISFTGKSLIHWPEKVDHYITLMMSGYPYIKLMRTVLLY